MHRTVLQLLEPPWREGRELHGAGTLLAGWDVDGAFDSFRANHEGESKRLLVESPWLQFTSECQRF
jgi:hypothetical protein